MMKKYLDKYFEFIGIDHEGYKRLTVIGIVLFGGIFLPIFIEESFKLFDIYEILFFVHHEGWLISLWLYFLIFILSPIIVGIILKIINWIIDGFKQESSSK